MDKIATALTNSRGCEIELDCGHLQPMPFARSPVADTVVSLVWLCSHSAELQQTNALSIASRRADASLYTQVALDMLEFEQSGAFQYADSGAMITV